MNVKDKMTELEENGFCVLRDHFRTPLIDAGRIVFWPTLLDYLKAHRDDPNRGPHRHFLPMPFSLFVFLQTSF
jgi:hypothetical protein